MRVATYNIRHAQGVGGLILPRRVARTIAALDCHAVGLQEVWHVPRQHQTEVIASAAGMAGEFAVAARRGALSMGNAVLAREPIDGFEVIELPSKREQRNCMVAELRIGETHMRFACAHLALHRESRRLAMELLAERLVLDRPLVLVGDFNAPPDELTPLREVGLTVPETPPATYPSVAPWIRLDHIAFSEHWELQSLATHRSWASDHLPLVAELVLR